MRKRILIADDNQLVRKLLHLMLERDAGWDVDIASDGREAILKAQAFEPDVVILDFGMPGIDGLQTAREISRVLPSASIILFTLYDSPEMSLQAKQAGVSRVLPKTAAGLPLIKAVEELLTKSEMPRPDATAPLPEPDHNLARDLVNDSATVIASPPIEKHREITNFATMQAEGSKSAAISGNGDGPPNSSTELSTEST